jgi:hypothetical protein
MLRIRIVVAFPDSKLAIHGVNRGLSVLASLIFRIALNIHEFVNIYIHLFSFRMAVDDRICSGNREEWWIEDADLVLVVHVEKTLIAGGVGGGVVLFGCFSKRLQLIRALPVLALYNKK